MSPFQGSSNTHLLSCDRTNAKMVTLGRFCIFGVFFCIFGGQFGVGDFVFFSYFFGFPEVRGLWALYHPRRIASIHQIAVTILCRLHPPIPQGDSALFRSRKATQHGENGSCLILDPQAREVSPAPHTHSRIIVQGDFAWKESAQEEYGWAQDRGKGVF